jgi:hypothetical protein
MAEADLNQPHNLSSGGDSVSHGDAGDKCEAKLKSIVETWKQPMSEETKVFCVYACFVFFTPTPSHLMSSVRGSCTVDEVNDAA